MSASLSLKSDSYSSVVAAADDDGDKHFAKLLASVRETLAKLTASLEVLEGRRRERRKRGDRDGDGNRDGEGEGEEEICAVENKIWLWRKLGEVVEDTANC